MAAERWAGKERWMTRYEWCKLHKYVIFYVIFILAISSALYSQGY
jgi:hypothetical protein